MRNGYDVVISNSRGPETLTDLVAELGDHATAGTPDEAARAADLAVVTTPLAAIPSIPADALAGKTVIDTNNYYPQRDGAIAELDDESTTVSELLQRQLPGSHVVKGFNHITSGDLTEDGSASGTPGRRALAISGDDADAKATVAALIDLFGFDVLDAGPLSEGWRIQRDTPGYGVADTAAELQAHLAEAKRYRDM